MVDLFFFAKQIKNPLVRPGRNTLINSLQCKICDQEKIRGQRERLPVQPLGYVMSTKVIFRRAVVFVLAEVCLPRRPHAGQPWSDV